MNTKTQEFINLIAAMTMDGENDFIMDSGDAIDTLNDLIAEARRLKTETELDDVEDDPDNTETWIKANTPETKFYTVILEYPGSIKTYTEATEAESAEAAINTVKEMAEASNNGDIKAEDFEAIAVVEGNFVPD